MSNIQQGKTIMFNRRKLFAFLGGVFGLAFFRAKKARTAEPATVPVDKSIFDHGDMAFVPVPAGYLLYESHATEDLYSGEMTLTIRYRKIVVKSAE